MVLAYNETVRVSFSAASIRGDQREGHRSVLPPTPIGLQIFAPYSKPMTKYVVSLTRAARAQKLQADIERVLRDTPSVKILEGHGRKVFTVLMTEDARTDLQAKLTCAVISHYHDLELLQNR